MQSEFEAWKGSKYVKVIKLVNTTESEFNIWALFSEPEFIHFYFMLYFTFIFQTLVDFMLCIL